MPSTRVHSEPFASGDAAWLRMALPPRMPMITAVLTFDEALDIERLKATITSRLLPIARFRQRVREPLLSLGLPRWEDDPDFSLDAHVHRIALPAPGDTVALQALAGDLMGTPLNLAMPLWQIHIVENYGKGSAVIVRLHHCIADGLALMQVLLSLTDDRPDAPPLCAPSVWAEPVQEPSEHREPLATLLRPGLAALNAAGNALHAAETVIKTGTQTLSHPARATDAVRFGLAGARALRKIALTGPDSKTILKGAIGITRRAVWSDPIPLRNIKAIGKPMGATITDVLLAATAGALGRYLESREQPTDQVNVRAAVMFSLRTSEEVDQLSNRLGFARISLPLWIQDPRIRLLVVKRQLDLCKNSPEPALGFEIFNVLGWLPPSIGANLISSIAATTTTAVTNLPGPRQILYLAGSPISGLIFWAPLLATLTLGINISSYNGEARIAISTDANLLPDPETILASFDAELSMMAKSVGAVKGRREETILPADAARCQGLTRSGQPCKNRAVPGGTLCRVHGRQNE